MLGVSDREIESFDPTAAALVELGEQDSHLEYGVRQCQKAEDQDRVLERLGYVKKDLFDVHFLLLSSIPTVTVGF